MLGTLAATALICVASILVGEAIACVLGRARWRGWSPAVGLAVLLGLSTTAVRLPGHGLTSALLCAALICAAGFVVVRRGVPRPASEVLAATGAVLALVLVPFLVNGRFGVLGVNFLNDMTAHLPWAETFKDPSVAGPTMTPGYPAGPHSLVATISSGTGLGVDWAFNGFLISVQLLIAWTVLPMLDSLTRARRALGATVVATCFLLSAFYVQSSFKETALALFLLASVALLRDTARDWSRAGFGTGLQAGALVAGIVFSYSYSGVAWLVLTLGIWALFELGAVLALSPRTIGDQLRGLLSLRHGPIAVLLGAAVAGAVLMLPDIGRLFNALDIFGSSPSGTGVIPENSLAHLAGPLSPYEIFGLFPIEDFRFPLDQRYRNGAVVGLGVAATAFGALWWILKRDLLVPAAAAATGLIALYLTLEESPYLTSKGYAVAAPFAMLLAVRALLERWPEEIRLPALRVTHVAVAGVFCALALYSGFEVLRGGQVGPRTHTDELRQIASDLGGQPTLFLGFDDFSLWELHGLPVALPVDAYHLPVPAQYMERRPEKPWVFGNAFDFDSVPWQELDRVRYAITPRTHFQSSPPPNFHLIERTPSYLVYERRGRTRPRHTLVEEGVPGALLDCSKPRGRALSRRTGWASVWQPPVVTPNPARYAAPGDRRELVLHLPRGRWELSQQYVAVQDVDVTGAVRRKLPASLDRPGPWYRLGELRTARRGEHKLVYEVGGAPLKSRTHQADLIAVAAVNLDSPPQLVPLSRACGRYVDWYTLGAERPAVRG